MPKCIDVPSTLKRIFFFKIDHPHLYLSIDPSIYQNSVDNNLEQISIVIEKLEK